MWWTSLWVRNQRVPLASVEVQSANHSDFFMLRRETDGTLNDDGGFGEGEFTLRLTAVDGQVITEQPFRVWFGLRHFGIAPAGIEKPNTGHHHLIIDAPTPPASEEIPSDKNHLHFGAGQSEVMLELPPGRHTLQLVMGDHDHVPHSPPLVSKRVTITVK